VTGALHRLAAGRPGYGSLKDWAVELVRQAIVARDLVPGTRIDQDEVAAALGISRAPVREAVLELAQKGYVRAVPRRGAFVASVTAQDVEDHYAVLALVSGMTAGRAAERLAEPESAELRLLHAEIPAVSDPVRAEALNRRFQSVVAGAGRSARMDSMLLFLGGALPGAFYFASPHAGAHEEQYRGRLLAALEARDAAAAVRASEDHMHGCAELTLAHLRETGYWGLEPAPEHS
jgi:DNA-binding GntR family transcriptional regulator